MNVGQKFSMKKFRNNKSKSNHSPLFFSEINRKTTKWYNIKKILYQLIKNYAITSHTNQPQLWHYRHKTTTLIAVLFRIHFVSQGLIFAETTNYNSYINDYYQKLTKDEFQ